MKNGLVEWKGVKVETLRRLGISLLTALVIFLFCIFAPPQTGLFDKIGIDADNLKMGRMPDGTPVGGGGMLATTEDNLRLMKLYADGGVWEGERILSDDYVKRATTNQNDSATEAINNPPALDNFVGYGYQIWMW